MSRGNEMKKVIVTICTIIYFSLIAFNAMAYPVNIVSSNFRVMGEYIVPAVYWDENDELIAREWKDSYDVSSSAPLESSLSYQTSEPWSPASAYVHSSGNYFIASSDASSQAEGWGSSSALATIIFNPLVEFNQIVINYNKSETWGLIDAQLIDATTNQQIWDFHMPYYTHGTGTATVNNYFQLGHTYELSFGVLSSTNGDNDAESIWTNDLTPIFASVPEPTTLFLLGLGMLGLVRIRKKIMK
jgi:hypothetical protein